MTTKRKIWFKPITAALFMLVLFAVTIVQVSHIHSSGLVSPGKNKAAGFSACNKLSSNSSCFICDYQLTKDADICYTVFQINCPAVLNISTAIPYTFTSQSTYPVFETRGPPSI